MKVTKVYTAAYRKVTVGDKAAMRDIESPTNSTVRPGNTTGTTWNVDLDRSDGRLLRESYLETAAQ